MRLSQNSVCVVDNGKWVNCTSVEKVSSNVENKTYFRFSDEITQMPQSRVRNPSDISPKSQYEGIQTSLNHFCLIPKLKFS